MTKWSFLVTLSALVLVVAGLLAAVAMAWPQQGSQPAPAKQPAQELPVGGPSQAGLFFPE